jgi:hypothetical protein
VAQVWHPEGDSRLGALAPDLPLCRARSFNQDHAPCVGTVLSCTTKWPQSEGVQNETKCIWDLTLRILG